MVGDIPSIGSSMYATSIYKPDAHEGFAGAGGAAGVAPFVTTNAVVRTIDGELLKKFKAEDALHAFDRPRANLAKKQMEKQMSTRRLVKVIIVDPDENVPLDKCVIYNGDEKMTDATDQELFFEIDIKNILDAYNAERVKLIDKKVKERTEHLEPAKVRDLRMVVVNVASF